MGPTLTRTARCGGDEWETSALVRTCKPVADHQSSGAAHQNPRLHRAPSYSHDYSSNHSTACTTDAQNERIIQESSVKTKIRL